MHDMSKLENEPGSVFSIKKRQKFRRQMNIL